MSPALSKTATNLATCPSIWNDSSRASATRTSVPWASSLGSTTPLNSWLLMAHVPAGWLFGASRVLSVDLSQRGGPPGGKKSIAWPNRHKSSRRGLPFSHTCHMGYEGSICSGASSCEHAEWRCVEDFARRFRSSGLHDGTPLWHEGSRIYFRHRTRT